MLRSVERAAFAAWGRVPPSRRTRAARARRSGETRGGMVRVRIGPSTVPHTAPETTDKGLTTKPAWTGHCQGRLSGSPRGPASSAEATIVGCSSVPASTAIPASEPNPVAQVLSRDDRDMHITPAPILPRVKGGVPFVLLRAVAAPFLPPLPSRRAGGLGQSGERHAPGPPRRSGGNPARSDRHAR
jgi:hypothetical protein